jgi:uncharacterized membrane protein YjgN (DUF898 family)
LLLSILTLGIYSAWAKVRRERYFHSHTLIDGTSFEYHGNPVAILKGRLIAVGLFLVYNISLKTSPALGGVILIILTAIFPWLLVSSLRFRLGNTSYRGLRFSFIGPVKEGYQVFLLWPILTGLSLYLLAPFAHRSIKNFQHSYIRFGTTQSSFDASVGSFYKIYFKTLGLVIATLVIFLLLFGSAIIAAVQKQPNIQLLAPFFILILFGLLTFFSLIIAPYFRARIQNLVWNGTRLGNLQILSQVSARRLLLLQVTNLLGIVFTIGLFRPFAVVRTAKYQLEQKTLVAPTGLDNFVAGEVGGERAIGDETTEIFDLALEI